MVLVHPSRAGSLLLWLSSSARPTNSPSPCVLKLLFLKLLHHRSQDRHTQQIRGSRFVPLMTSASSCRRRRQCGTHTGDGDLGPAVDHESIVDPPWRRRRTFVSRPARPSTQACEGETSETVIEPPPPPYSVSPFLQSLLALGIGVPCHHHAMCQCSCGCRRPPSRGLARGLTRVPCRGCGALIGLGCCAHPSPRPTDAVDGLCCACFWDVGWSMVFS